VLTGATVRLESPVLAKPVETKVGVDGSFSFQRLIPGLYTLVGSQVDFQEEQVQLSLKPREIQNITLQLTLRGQQISVNVNARSEPIAGVYSPSSTTLQRERIEQEGVIFLRCQPAGSGEYHARFRQPELAACLQMGRGRCFPGNSIVHNAQPSPV